MRTTDFSQAPDIAQATSQFVGATWFRNPIALFQLTQRWSALRKRMQAAPGYRGHRIWYRFPFTIGTIAFFADKEALLSFARTPEHAAIMKWVMSPGKAHGGFIRFYEVEPHGYSSGLWRAEEGHELKAIDRFTPLAGESQGPMVKDL
jgi:hypothetical protein